MSESTPEKKVYIKTFGCQMNEYDSGKMRALLGQDGYVSVEDPEQADVILVNTCSVREKPEHKLHSFIGEVKHLRKQGVRIGIAGCMAQYDGERLFRKYRRDVDLVLGPDQVPKIKSLVARAGKERVLANAFMDLDEYAFVRDLDPAAETSTGAFVTIQKGCDNKCTFCIVPATRGVEVSRASEEILEEVRACTARGIREITLIGQNVNSYGLKVGNERTFAELLYAVAEQPGVERIRYTTSHPRDMGPDVVQAYRDLPQLTSHLHLPVQSGSSRVLRRMKRFYTREHYLKLVEDLKAARPNLSLTTDIIVGFPGETEEDFEATMSLLEEVRFDASFSFKYSPRPGTPALKLEKDAVPPEVASERLSRFQARQRVIQIEENHALEDEVMDVLVEGASKWDPDVVCGRTGTFKMVNFPGSMELVGRTVPVRITRGFVNSLRGELVES
ncbi:MAG: tRNA (N6-isopentenyl adenosine(37)-C2)-methylthiotransferase MiaB [Myxococcota bacterium]|jgi:tRNA-2-methylthio-N6-dimethylallyladenosine synthase|nr:tRNA (N6-isopentenyl adenosine(37)-C2)-methylthiotransferase MiaB [Myxococcota bacterium]